MALFLSTHTNKVDKKGRVSVPAPFRVVLANQNFSGIVAYESFMDTCIEASGMDRIEELHQRISSRFEPYTEEYDFYTRTIFGGLVQMGFDGEGRIMLTPKLMEKAGITDQALFVGKGATFEIWKPEAYAKRAAQTPEMAKTYRDAWRSPQGGAK